MLAALVAGKQANLLLAEHRFSVVLAVVLVDLRETQISIMAEARGVNLEQPNSMVQHYLLSAHLVFLALMHL